MDDVRSRFERTIGRVTPPYDLLFLLIYLFIPVKNSSSNVRKEEESMYI